jgi:ABC-2 family transporter
VSRRQNVDMRIGHLIAREALSHLRSARFRLASGLALTLAIVTVTTGLEEYRLRQSEFHRRSQLVATSRAQLHGELTGSSVEPGLSAVRPPSPGSVIVRGLDGTLPSYWNFGPAGTVEGLPTPPLGQGTEVGALSDLEAIVRIVLGLLAITMGIDAVAGDRTAGTLASLLSQPLHRVTVAGGKLVGGVVAFVICLTLLGASILVLLWLYPSDLAVQDLGVSLLLFAIVSTAYVTTMTAMGMVIGSLARSHNTALTDGVGVWVMLALAAPQLAAMGPRLLVAASSRSVVEGELTRTQSTTQRRTQEALGKLYAEASPDMSAALRLNALPEAHQRISDAWYRAAADLRQILDRDESMWKDSIAARSRWTQRLGWANPATTYLQSATAVADTGVALGGRWRATVDTYQRHLNKQLFDAPTSIRIMVPTDASFITIRYELNATPITVQDVGTFAAPDDSLAQRVIDARWTLAILALYLVGSSVLAAVVFPRAGF